MFTQKLNEEERWAKVAIILAPHILRRVVEIRAKTMASLSKAKNLGSRRAPSVSRFKRIANGG
jgi:hypothetical protein